MRERGLAPDILRFGTFEVDQRSGELRKSGLRIKLQDQPFQVLAMLLEHPGEMVTREELRKKLWPEDTFVDFEHGLNAAINKLREALGDSADNPRFVETLPRRGYRFIAPLVGADGVRPAAPIRKIESIAVLPLENLSRDPEQEYFADGMTDALITNLGKIAALRVVSRTTAMHYKGTTKTLPEIARELNVDAVVEGSALRSGNRVRVTANLLHAPADRHLWAQSYERELSDVLALQSEVAQAIADKIQITLTPQERVRLARAGPVNPEAHLEYLKGRYHWIRMTEEGFRKGLEHFERAIAIDPHYPPAYAGVADCFALLTAPVLMSAPTRESMLRAKAAARKALELDETLAEAHVSLGRIEWYDWNWAEAQREILWAIELNANSPMAHHLYSLFLGCLERHDECIREAKRALELDPLSLYGNSMMAAAYLGGRRFDQAIEQCRKALELRADFFYAHYLLAQAYSCKGMYAEAIAEAREAVALSENGALPKALLGYIYAAAGMRCEALKILDEMNEVLKYRQARSLGRALIYAGLGDRNAALAGWEEAYQEHASTLVWLRVNPLYDSLRSDPRYQDLVRRMNFPP